MSDVRSDPTPLPLRGDTFLGVCEALGQDFGIHSNWFRLVFAITFYWNPALVVGAYLALGLVVAVSRYFFPRPVYVSSQRQAAAATPAQPSLEQPELPLAA